MLNKKYESLILYYSLFVCLLVISAFIVFAQNIGFSNEQILSYYSQKTILGLLKVNLPHTLLFGLFSMVNLHFLLFTSAKGELRFLTPTLYTFAALELLSPLIILFGLEFFSYVKLASLIGFTFVTLYICALLARSILFESK